LPPRLYGVSGLRMSSERSQAPRVNYLDWLRVLAVAGVFVFHAMHPFDTADWHVKNAEQTDALLIVLAFLGSWGLAFFFLIAGAGSFLALRWRTVRQHVNERLTRLLLPLLVAYALFSPLQFMIEERHDGGSTGSILGDARRFIVNIWDEPPLLLADTYHLWFVVFLLEFSLLGLPLFAWLRGPRGQRLTNWLGRMVQRRGVILLLVIPFAVVHVALQGAPGEDHGWGEFVYYFDFFLLGHVLMCDARLTDAVRRHLAPALLLGFAGMTLLLVTDVPGFLEQWWEDPSYSWRYAGVFALLTVQAWGWVVAALSLGMRAPAFQRPVPGAVATATMPFFIVHQPVILLVAFYVVQWDVGIAGKLAVVLIVSLLVSAALAWALSRVPTISLLFGAKRPQPVSSEKASLR
jgi:glucans biosynthesis protein C